MSNLSTQLVPKLRFRGFGDEWEVKKLSEAAKINPKAGQLPADFIYIDLDSVKNGQLLKENRISKKHAPSRAQRLLRKADIIFQTVRPYQKNNYFFNKDASDFVASTGYAQIRAAESAYYLYQYIHTDKFVNDVLVRCTGTNYPAINSNDLEKINICLPSESEQEKIARFLTSVDKKTSELQKKIELLGEYKKGAMQGIFSQKIRLKGSSGKWQNVSLGEIGKTYNGLQGKTAEDFGKGEPYVTYSQVFADCIVGVGRFGKVKILPSENQSKVEKGDIFFTTSSETPEEVGYSSVLLKSVDPLYLNSFCFGYRITDHKKLLPEFAQFLFRSHDFRRRIVRLAQGSTRYNLSKVELMKVSIKLPEAEEQENIAKFLTLLNDKIDLTERQLGQAKVFKKALIQQMFV